MRKTGAVMVVLLLVAVAAIADDLIDVVKMKDGNIYKGIIIENKIDDFILIQLSGGSQFKLLYRDIDSMSREKAGSTFTANAKGTQSSQPHIEFFDRVGLFSRPYYLFDGGEYPLNGWGSGYMGLVNAIEATVSPNQDFTKIIADYKGYVSTTSILMWGGLAVEFGGVIWMISSETTYLSQVNRSSYSTSGLLNAIGVPVGVMVGGLLVGLVGGILNQTLPTDLVKYYNTNY